MDRNSVSWRGYIPAITTPFDKVGNLDLEAFDGQMEWLKSERLQGVILAGTSGEWFSMTTDERARLFEAGAKFRSDDFVVLGAGNAFTKAEAITHAHSAEKVGLDGLLLTIPPYIVPNRHEIVSFYQSVSDASEIPLTVYNWPRGCVVDMNVD